MNKVTQFFVTCSEKQLIWLLTFLSSLIAWRVIYIQHGWINDDSVLYFEMARLFSLGEWKQGIVLFNWPFYPALISLVHQLTQLRIQTSAQILDVLLFTITSFSFLELIRLAGGNKHTIGFGAFLLLSSSYIVGDILPMLLRDQGFWAMFLTSLIYFIKFYRHQKLRDALLWQVFAILAVLFRIEAVTFLVCLPFLLFLKYDFLFRQNLTHFLNINIILIFLLLLILSTLALAPSVHLSSFGRLQEVVNIFPKMLTEVVHTFKIKADIMGNNILGRYLNNYGMLSIVVSLLSIITLKIINLISWPVLAIFVLSHTQKEKISSRLQMEKDVSTIFYYTAILALINACVIIASSFVLSSRYVIAFGLTVLIFAAFNITLLIDIINTNYPNQRWKKVIALILLSLLCLSAIKNILPKQTGYTYEQDAIAYLKQQKISNNEIFYVTPRSRYFAGAPYTGRGYESWDYTQKAIADGSIYQYNYLVINLDVDEKLLTRKKFLEDNLTKYKILKEFYGYKNKKKITIYLKSGF